MDFYSGIFGFVVVAKIGVNRLEIWRFHYAITSFPGPGLHLFKQITFWLVLCNCVKASCFAPRNAAKGTD